MTYLPHDRSTMRPRRIGALLSQVAACAFLTAASMSAHAQDEGARVSEKEVDGTIIVTGSRIKRDSFDASSPVTAIDKGVITESGFANLGDVLLRSPVVAVGQGLSNAQTASETAGATFANLRGLGSFRTLTLIDGRRRVPGSLTASSVDLSMFPPQMVERVEIVTGGTSAVYGADAVTGVINVILDRDYEGFEIDLSAGLPEAGGGGSAQQASLFAGKKFADGRGHVSMGLSYWNSDVLRSTDRKFSRGRNFMFFETNIPGQTFGDVTPTYVVRRDPTTFLYANTGTFWHWNGSAYDYYTVDPDLRLQQSDAPPFVDQWNGIAGSGWSSGGDGFAFDEYGLLRGGYKAFAGLFTADYEINDNITVYATAELAFSRSRSPYQPNFHPADGDNIYIWRDNYYLTPGTRQFMDDNGYSYLWVWRTHGDLGVRTTTVDRTNYTLSSGFKGTLANGWDYDVFAQYGKMLIDTATSNTLIRENYLNAVDAIADGSGNAVCRDPAARSAGCVPINGLGPNETLTAAQRAYLLHTKKTDLNLDQLVVGMSATGSLLQLPAGPLKVAAGWEYRDESLSYRDDPRNMAGELLLNAPTDPIDGGFDVWEVYGEAVVPILADRPFFDLLQIEGAVRYSDYSHIGTTTTWKLGATWAPVDDLRFRYTRSFSVRAPTVTDIFSPGISSFAFITDPCDATVIALLPDSAQRARRATNCAALGLPSGYVDPRPTVTKQVITGGNPDLEAEDSDSWTLGAVLTPSFVPGLRLSVDYWSIDLTRAISQLSVGEIINNCVDFLSIENDFCPLIVRDDATGEITSVRNVAVNVDRQTAKGIDVQASFQWRPEWAPGTFEFYAATTYLDELNFIDVSAAGTTVSAEAGEVEGTPLPRWRSNFSIAYDTGRFRVSWFGNHIGAMTIDNAAASGTYQPGFDRIKSVFYHNLYAHYAITDKIKLRAGVNNLLDTSPPANPFTFMGGGGLYDNNGRYFWMGANVKF